MEIKKQTVEVRVLDATPGHMLYRKDEPIESAYFAPRVYLGVGDSPENYKEIPEAEAKAETERREKEAAKRDKENNETCDG